MPRGAEYAGEPPQSDNAIPQGQDAAHGNAGKTTDQIEPNRVKRTAELPEALKDGEIKDNTTSGGSSGITAGAGDTKSNGPKSLGEKKGLGALPGT